jgi:hypothetical protein
VDGVINTKKGGATVQAGLIIDNGCKNTAVPFTSYRSRLLSAEGMLEKRQEGVSQTSTPLFY